MGLKYTPLPLGWITCFCSDKRGYIAFEKVPSHVGKYGHECCFPFGVIVHTYTCPKEEVRTELVAMTCGNGEYVVSKVSYAYSASHIEETFVTCMSFGLVVNNYWFFLGDFGYIGYFIYEKWAIVCLYLQRLIGDFFMWAWFMAIQSRKWQLMKINMCGDCICFIN